MKKIILGLSVFFTALMSAQISQDNYPTSNNSVGYTNGYDDEFYFPDDYYYEYPADYYSNNLYQSYYNDYRRSIQDVNWNRFFATYRLAPWQIQQIMMLNNQFSSYSAWNSFYRYNPDRWYYDRFYSLERILGPQVFVIFQNNYYNGYNPVVYYQNYRRQHYAPQVYIVPQYRNVNVNRYRVDKVKYHQANPRENIGFRDLPRTANGNSNNTPRSNGLREGGSIPRTPRTEGFRNGSEAEVRTSARLQNEGLRANEVRPQTSQPKSNGGFRNNDPGTLPAPKREIKNNTNSGNQSPGLRAPAKSSQAPGQRLTSR